MPLYRALTEADIAGLVADLALKAAINSQMFTGTPTLPAGTIYTTPSFPTGATAITQATGTNTTALASTAFVIKEVWSSGSSATVTFCGGL